MAVADASDMGHANVCEMIAGFQRSDMMENIDSFKNLTVWYACEKLAHETSG